MRRNTRQITQKTTDFPKFKIRASRWVAVQPCKERHMIRRSLEINRVCVLQETTKQ